MSHYPFKSKGVALIITMAMITVVGMAAVGILIASRDEIMIAGNRRRAKVARFAAEAGMAHFFSQGTRADGVRAAASGQEGYVIIPLTPVDGLVNTRRGHYTVKVGFCCEPDGSPLPPNRFRVLSEGSIRRGEKIYATSRISAIVETYDPGLTAVDSEAQGALSDRALASQSGPRGAVSTVAELPRSPR